MLLSVIIPIYNEATTLDEVLNRVYTAPLPEGLELEVILVESGSMDGSRRIVEKHALRENVRAIYEERPNGKGSAVELGFKCARGDIILIQDADLEYDTKDYLEILLPIVQGKSKFVLGSRHLGAGTYKIRKYDDARNLAFVLNVGSMAYHVLFWALYGVFLTDPQTMYKVFHRDCLKGITFRSKRFDLDWEIVCKFVKNGHVPLEIPISYNARSNHEGKKIRIWPDAWLALWAILKFRFGK